MFLHLYLFLKLMGSIGADIRLVFESNIECVSVKLVIIPLRLAFWIGNSFSKETLIIPTTVPCVRPLSCFLFLIKWSTVKTQLWENQLQNMVTRRRCLLVLVGVLCFIFPQTSTHQEDVLVSTYHVCIINDMPSDPPPLTVHCKSGDDDIGSKDLLLHEEYRWSFRVNFWETTLFFCSARWGGGKRTYIDAFVAIRDERRCRKNRYCLWSVREDGFYFSNDNSTWRNQHPWWHNAHPPAFYLPMLNVCAVRVRTSNK